MDFSLGSSMYLYDHVLVLATVKKLPSGRSQECRRLHHHCTDSISTASTSLDPSCLHLVQVRLSPWRKSRATNLPKRRSCSPHLPPNSDSLIQSPASQDLGPGLNMTEWEDGDLQYMSFWKEGFDNASKSASGAPREIPGDKDGR